ncbi:transcription elongation factor spt5 [Rhodotorula toruloides]
MEPVSPQANQGLDDGPPVPAAFVPSHTAPENDGALGQTLSEIEAHADENDVKDEEGEPADDQPEEVGKDPEQDLDEEQEGSENKDEAKGEAEDDEEEEEDDDEDEDEDDDRPRKKRRRRRGGNQFLDIEADVDEDEDEEEEEGEEGFVANDNFIVERREPRREADGGLRAGEDEGDDGGGDFDGDASHRRLDRRRMAQRDREAAELAEALDARYKRNKYSTSGAEDWAPKALLMPSVNDPSIWGIKCKIGRERDLILSISRKAAALAASDGAPMQIISAFQRDSLKGYIYVEARSEAHVRNAVHGLIGLYINGPNGIFLVDIEEMPDLLKTKQKKVDLQAGGWVRFKRGKYSGDLAQVIAPSENGDEIAVKFIPRIDLTPKDEALQTGSDGKKRKKGSSMPIAFRPPQRLFNADEISKIYGAKEVTRRGGGLCIFRGDDYMNGFCEKDIRLSALTTENVQPTIDELTRFQGDSANGATGADGSLDLTQIADATRTLSKTILQPGDHVDIFEGDQKGVYGTIESILGESVVVVPHPDLQLEGTKIEIPARSVRKRFSPGDHVKVMQGANADETGLVVKVEGDVVTFLSDLSSTEVSVFAKDVREAAEVGSGVNVIAGYELHDLVQLDPQTAGVIIKMERDQFRILDQTGSVRSLRPSQISGKVDSRHAVATDKEGYDIKAGEVMKETLPNNPTNGRRGKVLHVYRSLYAFLHSRDVPENGGVFVAYSRNLESTAPRPNKPKIGTGFGGGIGSGMNPERAAMLGINGAPQQQPQVATGVSFRPDGRINRRVAVTKGTYKGNAGIIKDVTGNQARVELHSSNKVITVDLGKLKEQKDDGTLVELFEFAGRGGGGGGYGGRNGFGREGSSFSTASNMAPLGGAGYGGGYGARAGSQASSGYGGGTGMYSGGKTPAPYAGGKTPAPQYGGATPFGGGVTPFGAGGAGGATPHGAGGGAFDPSGRTPGYGGGASSAWNASSRTPFIRPGGGANDAFNPSSRTPYHPGAAPAPGAGTTPNPYASAAGFDGGRTPDPRRLAGGRTPYAGGKTPAYGASGGRTPAYGARNGYGAASAPTPAATGAPTPAATAGGSGWDDDEWGSGGGAASAPTPAAPRGGDYMGAPTPAAGAPTPGAFLGAPTPGFTGAPTPAAYPSGPTPGPSGSYGAAAQTPGNADGYPYQTPGAYAGAATTAAEPIEEREMQGGIVIPRPSEWVIPGVKIIVKASGFQGGRLTGQHGIVKSSSSTTVTFTLDPYGDLIEDFPIGDVEPMPPYQPDQQVLVIAGDYRGERGVTRSQDGEDYWVERPGGKPSMVVNVAYLVELA